MTTYRLKFNEPDVFKQKTLSLYDDKFLESPEKKVLTKLLVKQFLNWYFEWKHNVKVEYSFKIKGKTIHIQVEHPV